MKHWSFAEAHACVPVLAGLKSLYKLDDNAAAAAVAATADLPHQDGGKAEDSDAKNSSPPSTALAQTVCVGSSPAPAACSSQNLSPCLQLAVALGASRCALRFARALTCSALSQPSNFGQAFPAGMLQPYGMMPPMMNVGAPVPAALPAGLPPMNPPLGLPGMQPYPAFGAPMPFASSIVFSMPQGP